ncbi:hypothetical protein GZL_03630 [Streptomyces sp. 769]|nr:hypothetical protein GZL_03630 [Streptomyces sp. 769]
MLLARGGEVNADEALLLTLAPLWDGQISLHFRHRQLQFLVQRRCFSG